MMSEWEKMPDSWITPEDYRYNKTEQIASQRKNKFRVNYFQGMSGHCLGLFKHLNNEDKNKFSENLKSISIKVRQLVDNKLPIDENLIDEMDNFANNLIEKVKYEKQ